MNGGDMDVYLTSNRIHYLCEESIQKYSTLKFKTKQGSVPNIIFLQAPEFSG
jgi:hypothetical protein